MNRALMGPLEGVATPGEFTSRSPWVVKAGLGSIVAAAAGEAPL